MGTFSWQWLVTGQGSLGVAGGGEGVQNSSLTKGQAIGEASVEVVGTQGTQERRSVQWGG